MIDAAQRAYAAHLEAKDSNIGDNLKYLFEEAHGTILELGTEHGCSTSALLAGCEQRGGEVWSVDIDPACANVFAGHPQWHFVCGDSQDKAAVLAAGLAFPLDVLFIDSEHSYGRCIAELNLWGPWVRAGGVILLHDTDLWDPTRPYAVRQAMLDFCRAQGKHWLWFLPNSFGLGMIRM